MSLCLVRYKKIHEKCDKIFQEKKYEQLRNYLFKMKEFIKLLKLNYSWKRTLQLNKMATLIDKRALGNQEGQVEIEYALIGICF